MSISLPIPFLTTIPISMYRYSTLSNIMFRFSALSNIILLFFAFSNIMFRFSTLSNIIFLFFAYSSILIWIHPSLHPIPSLPSSQSPLWFSLPHSVKFDHRRTGISVDICLNNDSGLHTGKLIKGFVRAYPPLRPLTLVLKMFLVRHFCI